MHTVETDGRNTIEEMAEAAKARGYQYMAITDHSKNLAMANGLDDKRALEHIKRIHRANDQIGGITILAGIECDILADGALDLSDDVLAQMDIVIASVHSHFAQERQEMTGRIVKAVSNPHVSLLGPSDGTFAATPRRLCPGYGRRHESRPPAQGRDGVELLP